MKKILKQIAEEILFSDDYAKAEEKALETERQSLYDNIINPIYATDQKKGSDMENVIALYASKKERIAFEYGFKCAMKLMAECNTGIRKIEE